MGSKANVQQCCNIHTSTNFPQPKKRAHVFHDLFVSCIMILIDRPTGKNTSLTCNSITKSLNEISWQTAHVAQIIEIVPSHILLH